VRVRGGYTFLQKHVAIKQGSDIKRGRAEGNDPENQVILQSMIDLPWHLEFDCNFRYIDSLPSPNVPSYVMVDLRLGWRPCQNLEFSS